MATLPGRAYDLKESMNCDLCQISYQSHNCCIHTVHLFTIVWVKEAPGIGFYMFSLDQVLRLLEDVGLPELVIHMATLAITEAVNDIRSQVSVWVYLNIL